MHPHSRWSNVPVGHRLQRFSLAKTDAGVDRAVRTLIRHAAGAVPYYATLFARCGLATQDIRGARDLDRIPVSRLPLTLSLSRDGERE